jgi:hypothetical protein
LTPQRNLSQAEVIGKGWSGFIGKSSEETGNILVDLRFAL